MKLPIQSQPILRKGMSKQARKDQGLSLSEYYYPTDINEEFLGEYLTIDSMDEMYMGEMYMGEMYMGETYIY